MKFSMEWQSLPPHIVEIITLQQKELPIKIGSIARDLGIEVKSSTLNAGISGEIRLVNDKYIIKVNRHDSKDRQRFTIAHEIAHFLLHTDFIGDGIEDDALYRSRLSDILEVQANRLAADLIMPWHLINDAEKKNTHLKGEEKYEFLSKLAQVSTTAIKIRLGKI